MTDPKTINEAGLTDIARRATDHAHDAQSRCSCMDALRLVSEVRRLRQLVTDAEPHIPDNERTRTMDLPARLKAEVDRGLSACFGSRSTRTSSPAAKPLGGQDS